MHFPLLDHMGENLANFGNTSFLDATPYEHFDVFRREHTENRQ